MSGNIPSPRSFQSILSGMIDTFRSKTGVGSTRVGGPILSILEAAAQSDVRSTQDVFGALDSISLDRAEGPSLDRIGADEDLLRRGAKTASGLVNFTDTSFKKISSLIYGGSPAPSVGSVTIDLADASEFPTTGEIYIGRGTIAVEGPIPYTTITAHGSHHTLSLSKPTLRHHTAREVVTLSQGGDRPIPARTSVSTTGRDRVLFATVGSVTMLDGETLAEGVRVVAQTPGIKSNVASGAVREMVSSPFPGAAVHNALPFSNGAEIEGDEEYRERIRLTRQTRQKGTSLAIKMGVLGVESLDSSKYVVSASVVSTAGKTTLYIDDGVGYEEESESIPYERLTDYAMGGESLFKLSGTPVAKAAVESTVPAPWPIVAGSSLRVRVGQETVEHVFTTSDFRNILVASPYEVVASINGKPYPFSARTAAGGTGVALFAKGKSDESIQVLPSDSDANKFFGFPLVKVETLSLFKNDKLLHRLGYAAFVSTLPQHEWATITGPATINVNVDGTGAREYTISAEHFDGTGYSAVSSQNNPSSWAVALNRAIPGIVAYASGDSLSIKSARGVSDDASISLTSGTITTSLFGGPVAATGRTSDYELDRNTGYLSLETPLEPGDVLTAGSDTVTGYLESASFPNGSVTLSTDAKLFFVLDSVPSILRPIAPTTSVTVTVDGSIVYYQASVASFAGAELGDWLVVTDPAMQEIGAWPIAQLGSTAIAVYRNGAVDQPATLLSKNGLYIVKNPSIVQTVSIPAGSYTVDSLAAFGSSLVGGRFASWNNETVLAHTNTSGPNGKITLVASSGAGDALRFPLLTTAVDETEQLAFVQSRSVLAGAPSFHPYGSSSGCSTVGVSGGTISPGKMFVKSTGGYIDIPLALDSSTSARTNGACLGTGDGYVTTPYALGPTDTLSVDVSGASQNVSMFRAIVPASTMYGQTLPLRLAGTTATFSDVFGDFDFRDFAVFQHARCVTHPSDVDRRILWRFARMGPEGESMAVRYTLPSKPSSPVAVAVDMTSTTASGAVNPVIGRIGISLPSGPARSVSVTGAFLSKVAAPQANSVDLEFTYANVDISRVSRNTVGVVRVETTGDFGVYPNDLIWIDYKDNGGLFTSGPKIVTATNPEQKYFDYNEPGLSDMISSGTIGSVRHSAALPDLSSVVAGDIVVISGPFFAAPTPFVVRSIDGNSFTVRGAGLLESPTPQKVNSGTLTFFPLNAGAASATSLVNTINGMNTHVTGAVLGTGTGVISKASQDDYFDGASLRPDGTTLMKEGVNWIRTLDNTTGAAVLKQQPDSSVTGAFDTANEEMALVPVTPKNVADWLNSPATSGLYLYSEAVLARGGTTVQLASTKPGKEGSVQVGGGTANAASASVVGSATAVAGSAYVLVPQDQSEGFQGGQMVDVTNSQPATLLALGNDSVSLTPVSGGTEFFAASTSLFTRVNPPSGLWSIVREGRFARITVPANVLPTPGQTVIITGSFKEANRGSFRVVWTNTTAPYTFWVENPKAVTEINTNVTNAAHVTYISGVKVGDLLQVSSSDLGEKNIGTWRVTGHTANSHAVLVEGAVSPISSVPVTAGSGISFVESTPSTRTYRVSCVSRGGPNDTAYIGFDRAYGIQYVSEALGSTLHVSNKLGFDTNLHIGQDGYAHVGGLVGEVSKVIHGVENDPGTYPGVVSAGHSVEITGPLLKAITLSFVLRLNNGIGVSDILSEVRSVAAGEVNRHGVGESVAISDLVAAVSRVRGIQAVTVMAPEYTLGKDMIPVQPHEKPVVLDPTKDVSVKVIGA